MTARTSWSPNANAAGDPSVDAAGDLPANDRGSAPADPLDDLMDARFDDSGQLVRGGRTRARNLEAEDLQRAVEDLARRVEEAQAHAGDRRDRRGDYDYDRPARPWRPTRSGRRPDDTLELLDRLEERLGVMDRRRGRYGWEDDPPRARAAPDLDRQIAALEARIEQLGELSASPASDDVRVDIAALGRQLDGLSRTESVMSGRMGAIQRQLVELREKLDEAGAPDTERFAALAERLEQIGAAVAGQQFSPESMSALEHGYNHILERIAKIERLAESAVPPDEVWERIDNLREALAHLPTHDNISVLESRMLGLNDRLEDLAGGRTHPDELANLDARLAELAAAVTEIRDRPAFDPADINERMEALVDRVETLRDQNRSVDLSVVEGRLAEIADLARRAAESDHGAALWRLEERLAALAERVEAIHGDTRAVDLAGVEGRLDDLAGVVGRIAESDRGNVLWKLEERLDDLSYNISEQDKRLAGQDLSGLRDSLEALHMRVGELADMRGSDDHAVLSAKLEAIGRRLDSMGGLTRADIAPIAARISTLETGIRSATADQAANLAPIQDRIEEIAGMLARERESDRVDARLGAIQDRLDSFASAELSAGLDEKLDLLNAALRNAEELAALDDVSELRGDIANLRRELRSMPAAMSGEESGTELMSILREITARFDRMPEEAPVTSRDLESQFGRFVHHVEEREAHARASLEDRLADIQSMLASGSPIAMAAAMAEDDASGDTVAHIVARVAGALSTDLGILKDTAAATEHNTRRALEAVHETLEAVVKRMAYLERDADRARTAGRPVRHVPAEEPADRNVDEQPEPVRARQHASQSKPEPRPRLAPDPQRRPDPKPEAETEATPDDDMDRAVQDAIASLGPVPAKRSRPQDTVPIPEITLSEAETEHEEAAEPTTFESLLDQHRPGSQHEQDAGDASRDGGQSLLGRLTPSQLLRRATGGRADSFSPGGDDGDDREEGEDRDASVDTPLEPGTDDPMDSSLEGAPSSDSGFLSGDRPGRAHAKNAPDPALVGAGAASGNGAKVPHPADEFLMAARRAAQAAAAEAVKAEYDAGLVEDGTAISRIVARLNARRRLVLASAVAIVVAFAALQFVKTRLINAPNPSPAPIEMSANAPQPAVGDKDPAAPGQPNAANSAAATTGVGRPADDTAMLSPSAIEDGDPRPGMVRPDDAIAFSGPEAPRLLAKPASEPAAGGDVMAAAGGTGPGAADDGHGGATAEATPDTGATAPAFAVFDGSVFPALPEAIGPERLRQEAATGGAVAMFEIASRYAEGRHVPQDLKAAATWYERAAEAGLAPAQYRLGSLYENGQGVTRNVRAAEAWYRRAAVAGNAKAMHNLAVLYAEGAGGNQDLKAAAGWFRRAAELGIRDSQFNIAILHARGLGVSEDLIEAYKWFAVAAASGDQQAGERRDTIAAALSRKNLAKAKAAFEAFDPAKMDPAANMVVPPEDGWGQTDPQKISQNMKELILRTQQLLSASGYDVGQPDGKFGPRTREAITAFQTDIGIPASGRVDTKLLAALEARAI